MFRLTAVLAAFAIAVAAPAGVSRAADPELPPRTDSFEERLDPSVDVSGQLLAGIMYAGTLDKVDVNALHVSFAGRPGKTGDQVCVRLASRDGVYSAKWTATLREPLAGKARLLVLTENATRLAEYPVDELVAITSITSNGKGCDAHERIYLPTYWGALASERRLILFLNSDTSDAVAAASLAGEDGGYAGKERCRILSSTDRTTAFDTICELPVESGVAVDELIVVRQNFSTRLDPLVYRLMPDPR